jgi:hypothetical protein
MAYIDELEMKEEKKEETKAKAPQPVQPPQANGIALPNETMNKIIAILRKLPYDTVGELMEEIKREAVGANITKQ